MQNDLNQETDRESSETARNSQFQDYCGMTVDLEPTSCRTRHCGRETEEVTPEDSATDAEAAATEALVCRPSIPLVCGGHL
jgi:hypothetical protein